MSVDLFIYGTLRDDALVERLTGKRFTKQPAVLHGYRRIEIANTYPWIEPDASTRVEGFLLEELDPESLQRIDRYEQEGTLYRRTEATAAVGDTQRHCIVYVGIPAALRKFRIE